MSDHLEAPDVLREAGCQHPTKSEVEEISIAADQRVEFERLEREMQEWRKERETELDRIRRRKAERRGEEYTAMSNGSRMALGLRDEDGSSSRRPSHFSPEIDTAVPLPVDAPVGAEAASMGKEVGPLDLPVGSAGNALTWDNDEEEEPTLKPELTALFEKAVQMGEIEPSTTTTPIKRATEDGLELDEVNRHFAGETFGRKGSAGSGLEVRIVE
jgi:hypothetical protein